MYTAQLNRASVFIAEHTLNMAAIQEVTNTYNEVVIFSLQNGLFERWPINLEVVFDGNVTTLGEAFKATVNINLTRRLYSDCRLKNIRVRANNERSKDSNVYPFCRIETRKFLL
jgi:predicted dinucleotide-utilizing enzyme